MTAAAFHRVLPVQCTPWCRDGRGHADAEDPDEQGCYSPSRRVELVHNAVPGQHLRSISHVAVQLFRDAYTDERGGALLEQPHIELYADNDALRLSPAEARALSAVLAELADAAQPL